MYTILDSQTAKIIKGESFNHIFDKKTGFAMTWGKTEQDDPPWCPIGPLIADIEVTTICHGVNGKLCDFCYKSNGMIGRNMSLETFEKIFDKLPKTLTQVAFGADAQCISNADIWDMMKYCRKRGVVPNITVAQITNSVADKLAEYCGSVAVSYYPGKDKTSLYFRNTIAPCYDSVKKLTDRGMTQVNIQCMISVETYDTTMSLLDDIKSDPRLAKMNSVIFLSLKQKGRGISYNRLPDYQFKNLIQKAIDLDINFGFDSCSCHRFLEVVKDSSNYATYHQLAEPCESFGMFSCYINVDGIYFPCSFCEGQGEWERGIDIKKCNNFLDDVWNNQLVVKYRTIMLKNKRHCPIYNI